MKKTLLLLLFTFLTMTHSFACLNGTVKRLKSGIVLYRDGDALIPYGHIFSHKKILEQALVELDSGYLQFKNIDYLSDKGLVLILLGRYEEAISLYLEIESTTPNRYSTASNIGTAYELIGDNPKALYWIKKSISIDPHSHDGSEWLHVKILEAKLSPTKPISSQSLILTDFGKDSIPKSSLSKKEIAKLKATLYFQLNERVSFVKPKDKIVALLYVELGNCAFLKGAYWEAKEDYFLAAKYGFSEVYLNKRIEQCKMRLDPNYKPTVSNQPSKELTSTKKVASYSDKLKFKKGNPANKTPIKKTTTKLYASIAMLFLAILSVVFIIARRKNKK